MSDFEINLTDVEELDTSSIGPMPAGDYEMVGQTWEAKKSKANLEALETMMNVPFDASLKIEEGRDKGDGTKWDDKNVIAKFNPKGESTPAPQKLTPVPEAPVQAVASTDDDDGFDWDK